VQTDWVRSRQKQSEHRPTPRLQQTQLTWSMIFPMESVMGSVAGIWR
jgi:hypothetical protein